MRTDYKELIVERKENAVWITINRPEVRNAFRLFVYSFFVF